MAPAVCAAAALVPRKIQWTPSSTLRVLLIIDAAVADRDEATPCPGAARSGRCTPSRRGPGDENEAMS